MEKGPFELRVNTEAMKHVGGSLIPFNSLVTQAIHDIDGASGGGGGSGASGGGGGGGGSGGSGGEGTPKQKNSNNENCTTM